MKTKIQKAMDTLRKAFKDDPDYAWGWHCNIAMALYDIGCSPKKANMGAALFMRRCFGVNTNEHSAFVKIMEQI